MNTEERVKQFIEMFRISRVAPEFNLALQELKEEDPLAFAVVEVYMHTALCQFPAAIRKGVRLIPRVAGNPWLTWWLFLLIGTSYRDMGEMELGESYHLKALEIMERMGDRKSISRTRYQICLTRFRRAEYDLVRKEFLKYKKDQWAWEPHRVDYNLGSCAVIKGQQREAMFYINSFLEQNPKDSLQFGGLEMKGLALRIAGKFPEAMEAFLESAKGFICHGVSYSPFPLAKALELSRLAGLEPPPYKLISKALALAKKGSWGEQAAAQEIDALLREDDAEAAEGLYEAAKNYLRAYQNIETIFSGLMAAYLAWKVDSPVFTKALKLIAPLVPLHPGFRKDPLLGDFMAEVEPFLTKALKPSKNEKGIRAYLIGELKVLVNGKELKVAKWHNNKAIKAFIYFLLSPKHRIPVDHLFYLLWPRKAYNRKNRYGLYTAVKIIRRHLGYSEFLTQARDFYQLEDVWTDLGELENLVRLADATLDPAEKEEYLARARKLARGDLLPEFPYDRHIEEYREYYKRLRKRLGFD